MLNRLIYAVKPLTEEQREYWEQALANAERAVEYSERMLGIIAVKESEDE